MAETHVRLGGIDPTADGVLPSVRRCCSIHVGESSASLPPAYPRFAARPAISAARNTNDSPYLAVDLAEMGKM